MMPWHKGHKSPGEQPARYVVPLWLYIFDMEQLEYAHKERRRIGQFREEILAFQKQCGKEERDTARFFKEQAAELLKQYRGWDAAITWIEGREGMDNWRHTMVAEPIAHYVDFAFSALDLYGRNNTKREG